MRECNCKPKEGLGVQLTPGFSECAAEGNMTRSALILLTIALSSSAAPSFAQTTQFDAPLLAPARTDNTGVRIRQGEDAARSDDGAYEEHAHAPPVYPPSREVDVTVGLGSSVDRAPRDIREPFDE